VQPEIVEAAAAKQKTISEKKAAEASLIRIHADKLDQLIDLVGELVIAGASANLLARKSGEGTLVEATSVLTRLVESIRDSALPCAWCRSAKPSTASTALRATSRRNWARKSNW
jgi:two-component system chemotaxis sensor kinase CheA